MAIKGLGDLIKKVRGDANLSDEQVEEELNKILAPDWIPKAKFNETSEELKTIKKAAEDNAALMKELQTKANLSDEYKTKINELNTANAEAEKNYKTQISKMRLDSAVDKGLTKAKARNAAQAAKLLDYTNVKLNDDGTVSGLDDAIAALKKDSAYLFEEDDGTQGGGHRGGSGRVFFGGGDGGNNGDKTALDAIRAMAGLPAQN